MSAAKPAVVRFYLDADVLGLAHVVAGLRNDATYPGDPGAVIKRRQRSACPITDQATRARRRASRRSSRTGGGSWQP